VVEGACGGVVVGARWRLWAGCGHTRTTINQKRAPSVRSRTVLGGWLESSARCIAVAAVMP
jgi:hypothetical protein